MGTLDPAFKDHTFMMSNPDSCLKGVCTKSFKCALFTFFSALHVINDRPLTTLGIPVGASLMIVFKSQEAEWFNTGNYALHYKT